MFRISAQHRIGGRGLVGWIAVAAVLVSACTAEPGASGSPSPPAVSVTPSSPGGSSVTEVKPTRTPAPTKTGRGDLCTQYRAMAKWSFDHQARPTPEAWAAELVRRLTVMRPLAAADKLAWLDALLRVYRLVARGAGAAAIGNEVAASNFPAAGTGLARYCKVDPALLQPR